MNSCCQTLPIPRTGPALPAAGLVAGALSLLLRHDLSACPQAARRAARLLERLADEAGLDADMRSLCERMASRLDERSSGGRL